MSDIGLSVYRQHYYRPHAATLGSISFGRAFAADTLMMLITCACYVFMWEVLNATVEKNFAHDYTAGMVKRARNSGLQGAALEAKIAEANKSETMYSNPLYRMSMTLLEPLSPCPSAS